MNKNYSSTYSIKEFASKNLIPKYFGEDVNKLNIGLLGYTTELISTITEDSFNVISNFIKEMFPNLASMPDSIYTYAALNNIDNFFAKPASVGITLFVNEKDILNYGVQKGSHKEFVIDSNMIIDIEGKQFMVDYNIIIQAKPYKNDYIFTALYDMNFINSLSTIKNPFIKIKRINYTNEKYIALMLTVRQVNKFTLNTSIINNDFLNSPSITFEFDDQLANFEIFYKAPSDTEYTQLTKKIKNSSPLKTPFCYYTFKNDKTVEISFTNKDNYFQPAFNSDFIIEYYTTKGKGGNFPLYTGNQISVTTNSQEYEYNNNIILFAIPQTESTGGEDIPTLDDIRSMYMERQSTYGAYTTENDLQTYFNKFKDAYGTDIYFIKKRDDIFERLFSSFSLFRDKSGNVIHTNTLNLNILPSQFDLEYEQGDMYILKPGRLFKYTDNSLDTVEKIDDKTINDDLSTINSNFIYTNPFLITVGKKPNIVGYYINSIDKRYTLEYTYTNTESIVQFICNSILIKRNALKGENEYKLTVNITPTTDLDQNLVDPVTGEDLNRVKLKLFFKNKNGNDVCYTDFRLVKYDLQSNIYTFEATLTTDDYMTLNQRLRFYDLKNPESGESEIRLIDMINAKISVVLFYLYPDMKINHIYDHIEELQPYTMTNIYSNDNEPITFINPINIIRSTMKYVRIDDENYYINITGVPFIRASTLKNDNNFAYFLETLNAQVNYTQSILNQITNNYSISIKFYNTYGKSKNFVTIDDDLLDRVNISIKFKVKLLDTVTDIETFILELKSFIKNYVENINVEGSNDIYISNLIKSIENNFSEIKYLNFIKINDYDSSIQSIENKTKNLNTLTKEERNNFIPEYLTISDEDIIIELL